MQCSELLRVNSSCDTLLLCFKVEAAYLLACFCIDEQPCWQQQKKYGVFRSAACLCTVFCNKHILRLVCCVHRHVGTPTGSACAQAFCCTHSLFACPVHSSCCWPSNPVGEQQYSCDDSDSHTVGSHGAPVVQAILLHRVCRLFCGQFFLCAWHCVGDGVSCKLTIVSCWHMQICHKSDLGAPWPA